MFTWIVEFYKAAAQWFMEWIVYSVVDFIVWALPFGMEVGCTLIERLCSVLVMPDQFGSAVAAWGGMPPQMQYIISQLGLYSCVSLWVGAVTIRAGLNLLPGFLTRF